MRRKLAILAACAAPALVAGCQQAPDRAPLGPERHKVQVTQHIDSIKVPFRENSAALPPSAKAGLQGFLAEIGAGRDAVVVVRAPTQARGDLGDQRRNAVLRFLKAEGFRPVERDALMPEVEAPASEVLVRVAQYGTKLPDCPDHSRSELGGHSNRHTSNHGCATNRNLGLMVANPRDLVRGRDLAPARTSRQVHRIQDYRAGKPLGGDGGAGGDGSDVAAGGSS